MDQHSALVEQFHSENLSESLAGEVLLVKVATLRNWRSQGKGPDYIKIGRTIKYPIDGIQAFLKANRRKVAS